MDIDNVTLLAICSIFAASFGAFIKIVFKSKCSDCIVLYGLIKIHREVALETEIVEPTTSNKV